MVLATAAGEDRAAEALRRLGVVRIATKYPRIAARHFLETGRQAEIVEVKGSVELAPLTGLAEGIVDLTATGTTLRENGLVIREEIAVCTRAADRQPGRPQAEGAGDRRAAGAAQCGVSGSRGRRAGSARGGAPRARPGRRSRSATAVAEIIARGPRATATRRSSSTRAGSIPRGAEPGPLRVAGHELEAAATDLDPAVRAGLELAIDNVGAGRRGGAARRTHRSGSTATRWPCASAPVASARRVRARRPRALPEHGRDGRRHGAGGRRGAGLRVRAARPRWRPRSGGARGLLADRCRRCLPDGGRPGRRRARLRHRIGRQRST